ncbi:Threonine/homoserine efflux transporter RhtA [Soonwooa buanensis]|uniref:Threonine/homoserine efflux transporter RhtA n=1 Tax=Soonwooa buanensis TaxID=619805 RepID=A0A1T5F1U1_9FLAO|nr:DMT family transporter [Soonwooa buanensis]SKB90010.1 Threonine/homoserine efflux transporter RhtA [Soonwooa buanensis]
MQQNNVLKGVILVGLGASFYGMLATFVKLAYKEGYTTAEVTTSQFVLGILGMLLLNLYQAKFSKKAYPSITAVDKKKLLLAGTSMGCTSLFYYLAVQYINVSVAIVLLMQSVWISVVIEAFIKKELPSLRKMISVAIVLAGTLLATNIINQDIAMDWRGIMWGLLAASSFATTMFAANTIATYASPLRKTLFMLCGGGIIVSLFLFFGQIGPYYFDGLKAFYSNFSDNPANIRAFDFSIFIKYGLILSLFGTILPPILFNSGFPKAGLGLGSIISSMELPVSVAMAFILLDEKVEAIQWCGIAMILFAIVLMNLPQKKLN